MKTEYIANRTDLSLEDTSKKVILLIDWHVQINTTKYQTTWNVLSIMLWITRTRKRVQSESNSNNYGMPWRRNKKTERISDQFPNMITW